jgi:RNA polymerase sigma-70 factor (ECF subfamily)
LRDETRPEGMMGEMAEAMAANAETGALLRDFGAWMASEQKRIFLLCRRMLQDSEDADSATQDTFLKAYQALLRNPPDIDDPGKWITRIAVNTCLDRLRSRKWQFWRKRPSSHDEKVILNMAPEHGPNAEDRLFAEEIRTRLNLALGRLSGRQRAVFTLRHFEGRSLEEIAVILGLDVGTVKAHMFRALAKLRDDLRDLYSGRNLEGENA